MFPKEAESQVRKVLISKEIFIPIDNQDYGVLYGTNFLNIHPFLTELYDFEGIEFQIMRKYKYSFISSIMINCN